MNVKLLLDENVSPRVAQLLRDEGVDACGVRDRGLLEATDSEVFARRDEQLHVLRGAITVMRARGDMTNTVLRIDGEGGMSFEDIPAPT